MKVFMIRMITARKMMMITARNKGDDPKEYLPWPVGAAVAFSLDSRRAASREEIFKLISSI